MSYFSINAPANAQDDQPRRPPEAFRTRQSSGGKTLGAREPAVSESTVWTRELTERAPFEGLSDDDETPLIAPSRPKEIGAPKPQSVFVTIGAYILLTAAVLAMSTIGAITLLLNRHHSVPNLLVWSWRGQIGWSLMVPCALYQGYHMTEEQWGALRDRRNWPLWAFISLCYLLWNSSFCVAIEYTTLPHALLFIDAHCVLIVLGKLVLRHHVLLLEGVGALVGVVGGALAIVGKLDHPWHEIVIGDAIALGGAGFAAIYITNSKGFRKKIPLFVYLVPTILFTFTGYTTGAVLFYGAHFGSTSPNGMFGWSQMPLLPYALFLGVVTMFFGLSAYVSVIKYLPAVVVSIVFLLNPVSGSIVGVLLGVASVPGPLELVGAGIMLLGTFLASYATRPSQAALSEELSRARAKQSRDESPGDQSRSEP